MKEQRTSFSYVFSLFFWKEGEEFSRYEYILSEILLNESGKLSSNSFSVSFLLLIHFTFL